MQERTEITELSTFSSIKTVATQIKMDICQYQRVKKISLVLKLNLVGYADVCIEITTITNKRQQIVKTHNWREKDICQDQRVKKLFSPNLFIKTNQNKLWQQLLSSSHFMSFYVNCQKDFFSGQPQIRILSPNSGMQLAVSGGRGAEATLQNILFFLHLCEFLLSTVLAFIWGAFNTHI